MKLSRTVLFMMATAAATLAYADTTIPAAPGADASVAALTPTDELITPISVIFDANGGTGTMEPLSLNADQEAALTKVAFVKTGYTFYGWAETKDGDLNEIQVYADGATVKFSKTTTLYARYAKNSYKVKFNANSGKGKMKAQKRKYNKPSKLSANKFTKKGWVFVGWSTTKKGSTIFKNKAKAKIASETGTTTLYARWAKKNYKVKFYGNGATSGKMAAQKMVYGKKAKLAANKFKRTGYTFKGWSKSKTAVAATYKNKKASKNFVKTGKTVKLYAVWAPVAPAQ